MTELSDTLAPAKKDSIKIENKPDAKSNKNHSFLERDFSDTARIKSVQRFVTHIDSEKFKDSLELENEDFMENMTDGGGSLTGYFQNGKLVKIAEWYGLSWGVLQATFYLKNDKLAFVKETEDHFYTDSMGTDPSRFDTHFIGEYYFDNDHLFDEVSVGHNRFEIDENDAEKEYPERFRKNREIILDHLNKK